MKTQLSSPRFFEILSKAAAAATLTGTLFFGVLPRAQAVDIPDSDRRVERIDALSGMYKVISSTDPIFRADSSREWFLDFGDSSTRGVNSGTVAVSLRQNPNVRVRIMVWQVFPDQARFVLGNQFAEGSRQAVAVADWKIRNSASGLVLSRGEHRMILQPADAADY